MFCRVVPYEGNEPYIFLSYCHKDQARVYPIFEQLALDGYRVWYDNGNHVGDDWLTNIEEFLDRSKVVVAFFSEASSLSNNCKSEVTYAIKSNKKVLPILLGTDDLPKGMRMLLSYLHYLKAADYSSDRALLSKLYEAEELKECRGPGVQLLLPPDSGNKARVTNNSAAVMESISTKKDSADSNSSNDIPQEVSSTEKKLPKKVVKVSVKKPKKAPVLQEQVVSEETPKHPQNEMDASCEAADGSSQKSIEKHGSVSDNVDAIQPDDIGKTTIGRAVHHVSSGANENTVYEGYRNCALLVQPTAQKVTILKLPQTKIGRSALNCDVVIEGNSSISKHHADIIHTAQGWYLRDADSLNGTYLNGEKLEAGKQASLENPTVFQLNDEYLALITDDLAWTMMDARFIPLLVNESTSALRVLSSDRLSLNRNNKWPDGTLADNTVHREAHALIARTGNSFHLLNESPHNTTCVNETKMQQGDTIPLASGDRIRLGDNTTLKFLMIKVQGDV